MNIGENKTLTYTNKMHHHIKTSSDVSISVKLHIILHHLGESLNKKIDKLLKSGVIRHL